jgi:DNA-binding CsgD family transcriptional regulator/anti-sigma regulatory factor (Ser/Thr protein kinase)
MGRVMGMVIRTHRDLDSGVTTLWLDGELTWSTLSRVRIALAECVMERPVAVIVELSDLRAARPSLLGEFPPAARRATLGQSVPVLLSASGRDVAGPLATSCTSTQVYASHGDAVAAVRDGQPRWVHARMTPTPTSAYLARILVDDVCVRWELPHLQHPARMVVSELASNAIEHAASDFEVTAAQVGTYLRIGVQDRSLVAPVLPTKVPSDPAAPPARRGRGLQIVQHYATHWDITPLHDGKIVWALLRIRPTSAVDPGVASNGAGHRSNGAALRSNGAGQTSNGAAHALKSPAATVRSGQLRIRPEHLSRREVDVLNYLPTMLTVGEIALELHVTVSTVKAHMKSIYRKLDASRRREAVDHAYGLGIIARTTRVANDQADDRGIPF